MELQNIILILLSGLGVFHGIFIALVLGNYKGAFNISNKILSVLMIILSIRVGKSVLREFSKNLEIIYVYLGLSLLLFIGPLFYLYSRSLIHKQQSLNKKDWVHFLPGVFFIGLAFPLQQFGFKNLPTPVTALLFFIFYVHLMVYLLLTKKRFLSKSGSQNNDVIDWLTLLFYGLISIWIVYVLNIFEDQIPYIIGPIVYSLTVYTITYLAVSKKYLQLINTVKHPTNSFNEEETKTLFTQIDHLVKEEKLYLDPAISLAILSKHLKASTQKISFTINTKSGYNFNEYINRYRVDYAIHLLTTPEGKAITIAAIGTDAGFNSLSSFNQAFKKVTGKTPSKFRVGKID